MVNDKLLYRSLILFNDVRDLTTSSWQPTANGFFNMLKFITQPSGKQTGVLRWELCTEEDSPGGGVKDDLGG